MRSFFTLTPRRSFFILFFLFLGAQVQAQVVPQKRQELEVTFKVVNQKREPISFATFTTISRADSLQSQKKVADSNGIVVFRLSKGKWLIRVSSINYDPLEKEINISGNQTIFSFAAEPLPKTLGGVVVTSQKPLMRQEDDKTIIDPENIAASSTSGYEVIEKTPGLYVDQDGNIYINSLTPAMVYINGREMKMSASDIATLLKSLPPNSIAKIEILRTPSAKYDASGSGGIVNVVLKKGVKIGLTGSINTGWQQGKYGNEFIGLNLNNNDGKKSSYLNFNYSKRNSYERIKTDRLFAPDSLLSQDAYTRYPSHVYFMGYGISNAFSKKWEVSFDGRLSRNNFDNSTDNQSVINKISNSQVITSNLNRSNNQGYSFNFNNGVSSKYKIDSLGSEWTNDLSFTFAHNKADQSFNTVFYTPVIPVVGGDGNSNNKRNFFTGQTDLKLKFPHQYTIETGLKISTLDYHSITGYFKETGGVREKDNARTNTFTYTENINAAYLQGSKTIKDIVIKVGTRVENTNMKGRQIIPSDTSFNIHRTDLFPYVYISKKVMKIAGYELRAYLVYRRTISRPVYEQLNPFPRFVDQYLSEIGNPALRPQFTTNYEANISVDERPILAIGVNKTRDIFTNVIYQSDSSRSQAFRTYDNLGSNKEWYLRALGALPPGKKYFFVLGAQYNHNFYQGLYENQPLLFKKGTWTFFTYHTLKLDKLSQVTLNGFIRLRGQQQFYELSTFGALNTSINRQFFKQKLIVTLSFNDIFKTNKNDFTIRQGSVDASGFRESDTRRFGVNIRYNFGVRKKEENNMFNVESPERQ
jgi:iron complex outermembrane recepter protein